MLQPFQVQQHACSYYALLRKRASRQAKKRAELIFPPSMCTACSKVSDIDHDTCRFKGKCANMTSIRLILDFVQGYRLLGKDMQGDTIAEIPNQPLDKEEFDSLAYPTVFNERPTKDDVMKLRVGKLCFFGWLSQLSSPSNRLNGRLMCSRCWRKWSRTRNPHCFSVRRKFTNII